MSMYSKSHVPQADHLIQCQPPISSPSSNFTTMYASSFLNCPLLRLWFVHLKLHPPPSSRTRSCCCSLVQVFFPSFLPPPQCVYQSDSLGLRAIRSQIPSCPILSTSVPLDPGLLSLFKESELLLLLLLLPSELSLLRNTGPPALLPLTGSSADWPTLAEAAAGCERDRSTAAAFGGGGRSGFGPAGETLHHREK